MLYFKALREGLSRAAAGRSRDARAARRARRARRLAGAARGARARRSGDRGAPRAHRCAAHPARARGLRASTGTPLSRAAGRARGRRRRSGRWCRSRCCRRTARGCTRRSPRASTRCSPPGWSTSCARCARRYALHARPAVDALRRLPAGVGVPRRRDRRADAARQGHRRDAPARQAPVHLAARDCRRRAFDADVAGVLASRGASRAIGWLTARACARWPSRERCARRPDSRMLLCNNSRFTSNPGGFAAAQRP